MQYKLVRLTDKPEMMEQAALWFHQKWGIPLEAYQESMTQCLQCGGPVPQWYMAMDGERIVGGMGVIENDFHERHDLAPNVCAVYTEEDMRGQGIARALLDFISSDMKAQGIDTRYLVTGHTSLYERYGWEYYCPVMCDGEEEPSRMYIHRA